MNDIEAMDKEDEEFFGKGDHSAVRRRRMFIYLFLLEGEIRGEEEQTSGGST